MLGIDGSRKKWKFSRPVHWPAAACRVSNNWQGLKCKTKQQCKDTETKYINELNPRYNKNKRQHKVA